MIALQLNSGVKRHIGPLRMQSPTTHATPDILPLIALVAFAAVAAAFVADRRRIDRSAGNDMLRLFKARRAEYSPGGWRAVLAARILLGLGVALIVGQFSLAVRG